MRPRSKCFDGFVTVGNSTFASSTSREMKAGRQSSAMSLTGGGARQKRWRRPRERGLSVPKEPPLLRDLEANQTAGPRRDRLDRLPLPWSAGGGPKGERNGMYRHGLNTKEAVKEHRFISDLLRQSRAML